ncbi:MAG: hypothetical protein NT148_00920, partial [Candidatus Nealsonbacteria bacterium]|nr:hypothetical protein [Candidatus Nealsonbacteria bacterium]
KKKDLSLHVIINQIHQNRIDKVEKWWSKNLKISRSQFTKTTLVKRKNRKIYKNFQDHYGTITVCICKGGDLRHIINGLISGLAIKSRSFFKKPA